MGRQRACRGSHFQLRGSALGRLRHDQEGRPPRGGRDQAGAIHHGLCHESRRRTVAGRDSRRAARRREAGGATRGTRNAGRLRAGRNGSGDSPRYADQWRLTARDGGLPTQDRFNLKLAGLAWCESRLPCRLSPCIAAGQTEHRLEARVASLWLGRHRGHDEIRRPRRPRRDQQLGRVPLLRRPRRHRPVDRPLSGPRPARLRQCPARHAADSRRARLSLGCLWASDVRGTRNRCDRSGR